MKGSVIACRYARALFDIGAEAGEETLDRLHAAMRQLTDLVASVPELADALRTPVISGEEKKKILSTVARRAFSADTPEMVCRLVDNFCGLLAERHRLPLLTAIMHALDDMLDERRHIVRGMLCTAVALSPERRAAIRADLESRLGGTLELEYQVEPAILGGLTVRLGERVLDASLRTQLATLRDTIRKGE